MTFRFFFFNDTATTEIYTLSLHDALPIFRRRDPGAVRPRLPALGRDRLRLQPGRRTSLAGEGGGGRNAGKVTLAQALLGGRGGERAPPHMDRGPRLGRLAADVDRRAMNTEP